MVLVKLYPFAQQSLKKHHKGKLFPKYFGSFLQRIGKVAYKLALPPKAQMHHTFHVSFLKQAHGSNLPVIPLPQTKKWSLQPRSILDRKIEKKGNKAAVKVLIHWEGLPILDASWEFAEEIQTRYPNFAF
uniref:uncharacterized protein LOC122585583 n=1 Tax=Erigeron canadensis TaxID=72917 RepID=UPI001CB8BA3B|nr:uncharacterized protein LOC122585583 [Erigeron canadensis]